jgi:hypothetical protein
MGRRGRRSLQFLVDLKEKIECGKLKEEMLDRTLWRTRCGKDCERVIRRLEFVESVVLQMMLSHNFKFGYVRQ